MVQYTKSAKRNKKIRKISNKSFILEEREDKEKKEELKEEQKTEKKEEEEEEGVTCPLCQEGFKDKDTLEEHAMTIHSINAEGLQRLMMLMQGSHWLNNAKNNKEEDPGMHTF